MERHSSQRKTARRGKSKTSYAICMYIRILQNIELFNLTVVVDSLNKKAALASCSVCTPVARSCFCSTLCMYMIISETAVLMWHYVMTVMTQFNDNCDDVVQVKKKKNQLQQTYSCICFALRFSLISLFSSLSNQNHEWSVFSRVTGGSRFIACAVVHIASDRTALFVHSMAHSNSHSTFKFRSVQHFLHNIDNNEHIFSIHILKRYQQHNRHEQQQHQPFEREFFI